MGKGDGDHLQKLRMHGKPSHIHEVNSCMLVITESAEGTADAQ